MIPASTQPQGPLTWSATRIAAAIASGDTSARSMVETHLAHLRRHNPALNAVVLERGEEALREADAVDAARLAGERLPLFAGVPCTIKESFFLAGTPLTAGLVARRGETSDHDGPTVQRLRATGAIPLGITNVSELLMWMESDNRVYGRSNNPYDPSRIVGGSSGGEGCAVSAGFAAIGLGSDVGGSVRLPAFFNGVFGHKCSAGLIPNQGQWPVPISDDTQRLLSTGPLCRRGEDLWPMVRVLAGPHPQSPDCVAMPLGDPASVDIEGLRVWSVESNGIRSVHPELIGAQRRAAAHLAAQGARVERIELPLLGKALGVWAAAMSGDEEFGVMLGGGKRKAVLPELIKFAFGRSDHTFPALALAGLELIPKMLPDSTAHWLREGERMRAEINERIGDGVLLFPTYTRPAPRHGRPILTPLDWSYTAAINALHLPSTQVPMGLGTEGLPLGFQVLARHGQDHRSVAVALELERHFGGWVPPRLIAG